MPEENQRDLAKQLAKQGDPKAIASAINHSLKPKGINADVMRDNGCLHVMLEGEQVPHHQKPLVNFIENGMKRLEIESIYTVKIYGRDFGDDLAVWEDEIILKSPPEDSFDFEQEPLSPMPEFEVDDHDDEMGDDDIPEEVLPDYAIVSDEDAEEYDFDDDESIDEDDIDDDIPADYNPEEDDDLEEETEAVKQDNKAKILLFVVLLILLAIAAVAGLHFSGILTLPFLSGGTSDPENVEPLTDETTPETAGETPAEQAPADPWAEAVRTAISAANLAQTAQSRTEWENVASQWRQASELMGQVPESSENYQTAQQKATEYQANREIALQRAASAPQ
ncbi:hypothetical protein ACL6C3_21060 [Capilliphycus salinus ALCB114379]|uniref:hypothetical protein n=1 Tax=Capilliphycus salinus TaxID=2768948 RepID=UPI0039A484AE